MKRIRYSLIALLSILFALSSNAQVFDRVVKEEAGKEILFSINKDEYKAVMGVNSEDRTPKIVFEGRSRFVYTSGIQDAILDFEVFSHPKSNKAYFIVNSYKDFSQGAELFVFERGVFLRLGYISVASYLANKDGLMDYCSISKYITILEGSDRTYISFETPIIVLNPGQHDEEIKKGNEIYYTLKDGKLELNTSN